MNTSLVLAEFYQRIAEQRPQPKPYHELDPSFHRTSQTTESAYVISKVYKLVKLLPLGFTSIGPINIEYIPKTHLRISEITSVKTKWDLYFWFDAKESESWMIQSTLIYHFEPGRVRRNDISIEEVYSLLEKIYETVVKKTPTNSSVPK
jgi:hypothetical protein